MMSCQITLDLQVDTFSIFIWRARTTISFPFAYATIFNQFFMALLTLLMTRRLFVELTMEFTLCKLQHTRVTSPAVLPFSYKQETAPLYCTEWNFLMGFQLWTFLYPVMCGMCFDPFLGSGALAVKIAALYHSFSGAFRQLAVRF